MLMVKSAEPGKSFQAGETVVWRAYPSWAHFIWLYFFSLMAGFRALLFLRFGVSGWEMWLVGAGILVACAVFVRRWAHYSVSMDRVVVRNGYTGREIHAIMLSDVRDITVRQGPLASFFGIGTVIIRSTSSDRLLSLRGVDDPEGVKLRIEALAPKRHMGSSQAKTNTPVSRDLGAR